MRLVLEDTVAPARRGRPLTLHRKTHIDPVEQKERTGGPEQMSIDLGAREADWVSSDDLHFPEFC